MADLIAIGYADEPVLGWTVVLRRQPVHLVEGHPEGGYVDGATG